MRRKIDLIILLLILIAGFFAIKNAQSIGDWWHAEHYSPPAEIAKLAQDSGMNENGKKLFFRLSPQFISSQKLIDVCGSTSLGCTEGHTIYISEARDRKEYKQDIVTAAHEMLHVAYSRLSSQERASLEPLLKSELSTPQAKDIVQDLKSYPPEAYYNEAHSFIGSQITNLNSELEAYYSRYFTDRSKTTEAFLRP